MTSPVFISVRPGGRAVRYRKVSGRWRKNPIQVTGTDLLLVAGGAAFIGLVGYWIWSSAQDSAAADGSTIGGNENPSTILGPGSPAGPLGPVVPGQGNAPFDITTAPGPQAPPLPLPIPVVNPSTSNWTVRT